MVDGERLPLSARVKRDFAEAPVAVYDTIAAKPKIDVSGLKSGLISINQTPRTHFTDVTDLQAIAAKEAEAAGIPPRVVRRLTIDFVERPHKGTTGISVDVKSPVKIPDLFQPGMWRYNITHFARKPRITINYGSITQDISQLQATGKYTRAAKESIEHGLNAQTREALFTGLWRLSHRREHQKLAPFIANLAVFSGGIGYVANLLAKNYIGVSTSMLDFFNDVTHSSTDLRRIGVALLGVVGWALINNVGFGRLRENRHVKKYERSRKAFNAAHDRDDVVHVILPQA